MVHALGEIHRVLAPGGILVDARPDSRVPAYAELRSGRAFDVFGLVKTAKNELGNDRAADLAIEQAVRTGLFESLRKGRFWHRVRFDSLAELRRYLWEHQRFAKRATWLVDRPTLERHANDRFVIRRAVRFELLAARPRL